MHSSANDPRIRILTQDHLNAGAARNAGIWADDGKYIHFLDADDEIIPSAHETCNRAAEKARAKVCECLYWNVDAEKEAVVKELNYRPMTRE